MEPPMETANTPSPTSPSPPIAPPATSTTAATTAGASATTAGASTTDHTVPSPQLPSDNTLSTINDRVANGVNGLNGINGINDAGSNNPAAAPLAAATNGNETPTATGSSAPVSRTPSLTQLHTEKTQLMRPSPSSTMPAHVPATPPPGGQQHQFQRPQMQRRSSASSSHGKVPIVEPPGTYSRQSSQYNSPKGFPSPNQEYLKGNPKFIDDNARLTYAIQQSIPEAVRRAIRNNWEKAILGSEFHHAFLLNAVIHHANGAIIRRAIKEFGGKMVSDSKNEIIEQFKSNDLDEVSDLILSRCSNYFLDKAMEKRLKTIDARSLINALARAERLGYENSDVLDDQRERVMPTVPSMNQGQSISNNYNPKHPRPVAQATPGGRVADLQCRMCWRKFTSNAPYEYHVQKQVCTKPPPNANGFPFSCAACGTGFITKVGQQYHQANNVCGEHATAPATPRPAVDTGSPILLSSGNNSPMPASAMPAPPAVASSPYYAPTPVQQNSTTGVVSSKDFDPYAHLNEATLARLNEELRQAEISFAARFKEAEGIPDPTERKTKLDGLQNSFSTKQSIIRKKYGVRLRNRRTRAEIEGERQRMGLKHTSPSQREDTPSSKRQRTGQGIYLLGTQPGPLPNSVPNSPSKHLAVSDINTGLGGSSATAALTDPTLPAQSQQQTPGSQHPANQPPPHNSLSSLQRKGYRVSSHVTQPGQPLPTRATQTQSPPDQRSGSASAPVVLDDDGDSSDGDSDSDEEIPASLPPGARKPNGTPQKGLAG
ncbi:hypothetical protein DL766_007797 [Monosporascus sp. MC13-8B]|nr:hypothetical protein DL763_008920 [Monosporascus cannonballus]RYP22043.1 hypothetical protein DL766_007797 [Monosporascus sp. MC13-8B]